MTDPEQSIVPVKILVDCANEAMRQQSAGEMETVETVKDVTLVPDYFLQKFSVVAPDQIEMQTQLSQLAMNQPEVPQVTINDFSYLNIPFKTSNKLHFSHTIHLKKFAKQEDIQSFDEPEQVLPLAWKGMADYKIKCQTRWSKLACYSCNALQTCCSANLDLSSTT